MKNKIFQISILRRRFLELTPLERTSSSLIYEKTFLYTADGVGVGPRHALRSG